MYENFSKWSKRQRLTLGSLALSCAAILYAAAASSCCDSGDAIIHDECVDAGASDSGDAGTGGASSLPACD